MLDIVTSDTEPSLRRVVPMPPRTGWVMTQIRDAILEGRLTAGQPLVEADLAQTFGVSKTPVREALKTLTGQGLVRLGDFKGATVSAVDARLVRDVSGVRLLLEPSAVGAAVRRGADLGSAHDALRQARAAETDSARSVWNREFHRALYESCGNDLLVEILDGLRERATLIAVTLWKSILSWDMEAEEHEAIYEAASSGAADEAERLTTEHIQKFADKCFAELA